MSSHLFCCVACLITVRHFFTLTGQWAATTTCVQSFWDRPSTTERLELVESDVDWNWSPHRTRVDWNRGRINERRHNRMRSSTQSPVRILSTVHELFIVQLDDRHSSSALTTLHDISSLITSGTLVPECFKGDSVSQWKSGKFDPCSSKNPWTDRNQNLHGWLRRVPLPVCKIS